MAQIASRRLGIDAIDRTDARQLLRESGRAGLRILGTGQDFLRSSAAEQLVEDDAEAVDVAPLVGLPAQADGLLGAHVGRRADDHAVAGEVGLDVGPTRQAEIDQPRPPAVVDHHVAGLEVAMDDAHAVRVAEGVGEVADDPRRRRGSIRWRSRYHQSGRPLTSW